MKQIDLAELWLGRSLARSTPKSNPGLPTSAPVEVELPRLFCPCGAFSGTQIQSMLKPEPHLACWPCADAEVAAAERLK